jgi:hypothetical protein
MRSINPRTLGVAALITLALGATLLPSAHSQGPMQVAPHYLPIGVAASGNSSTVWFHEISTGRALACQATTSAAGLAPIQCVTVKLPRAEP